MRSEFRVDVYREQQQQENESLQVSKTCGCFWACYCPKLFSVSRSTSPYKYSDKNFRGCQSKYLGVFQILIGILCIAANTAEITMGADFPWVGQGIWGGVLMAVAGSFGVAAGKQKSKYMIVGMALWSMVAFLAAAGTIAPSANQITTYLQTNDRMESQLFSCRKFLENGGTTERQTTMKENTTNERQATMNETTTNKRQTTTKESTTNERQTTVNEATTNERQTTHWWDLIDDYEILERYKECRRFMDDYREDTLYTEKLAMNVALVVLASVAIPLLLWSFVLSVMPFSDCCGRNQESSDSESEQEYNIIGTDQLIVTSQSAEPPQYTGDTTFSMPNTTNAYPYQPTDGSIDSSVLAVIEIGGKSVEKLPLTDHV